jgi:CheY-like chemotaxis protein
MTDILPDRESSSLMGRRILVVEDDQLLSVMLEDALTVLGCTAVRASDVAEAIEIVATVPIDGAILDLNIAGTKVYPVAEKLAQRGLPFFFVTGYVKAIVPPPYSDRPLLKKPFRVRDLEHSLQEIMAEAVTSQAPSPVTTLRT